MVVVSHGISCLCIWYHGLLIQHFKEGAFVHVHVFFALVVMVTLVFIQYFTVVDSTSHPTHPLFLVSRCFDSVFISHLLSLFNVYALSQQHVLIACQKILLIYNGTYSFI